MARRRHRRGRSGSSGRGSFSRPLSLLAPAAIGAGGALAVNGLVNYAIPDSMKETLLGGNMVYVTRLGVAVLLGMLGPKLPVIGKYAGDMAKGAIIVTLTDFAKLQAASAGYNLSGMGSLGYTGPGRVVGSRQAQLQAVPGRGGSMGGTGMYVGRGTGMYVNRK